MAAQHPQFLSVGDNQGTTNSFAGVDIADLAGGVYNAESLTQGNNAACSAFQAAVHMAPDRLSGLFANIQPTLDKLNSALGPVASSLGCPRLQAIHKAQFNKYGLHEDKGERAVSTTILEWC